MSGENVFLQLSLYFGLLELLSSHYRAGGEQMQHQINASSTQVSINVFFFSGKPYFSFKRQMAWCFCVICIGEEPLRWQSVCDELFKFAFHLIKVGSYQAH